MFTPLHGVVVASRYQLVREIGRGGMGCVWEALDLELRAPCALKFILEQAAALPEMRTRFLREARGVAKLKSPHVVNIRSVGEHEDALFIAMELLHGETLRQRLEREGTLSPSDTLLLVQQVASVLTDAHDAGVIHRDLKPENIWLWSNPELFVKVIDFGVAKHLSDNESSLRTATGALVGTPRYMSPEQAAGDKSVDHRTDLWSLALIVAECLSGRPPFDGVGLRQVLITIILGPVPSMAEMYSGATPELEAWWRHATANRAHRFQSAHELAQGLAAALTARAPLAPTLLAMPMSEWSSSKRETAPEAEVTLPAPNPTQPQERIQTVPSRRRVQMLASVAAVVLVAGAFFVLKPPAGGPPTAPTAAPADFVFHPSPPDPRLTPPAIAQPFDDVARAEQDPVIVSASVQLPDAAVPAPAATAEAFRLDDQQPASGRRNVRRDLPRDAVYRPVEPETPLARVPLRRLPAAGHAPDKEKAPKEAPKPAASSAVAPSSPPPVDTRIGF